MSIEIEYYLNDGASTQARACLPFINDYVGDTRFAEKEYEKIRPKVARWENFREQGYIITVNVNRKQLNIAIFEHRNSDALCAVMWHSEITLNSPTIDSIPKEHPFYQNKYDYDHSVDYGDVYSMARWVNQKMDNFYKSEK